MQLTKLRPVYEHEGPFATVYLEGRSPAEDAAEQIRLRWRALRERLEADGAGAAALRALDAELDEGVAGEQQTDGRVLVASGSGVLLDEPWDVALGAGDEAHWDDLPQLGAYAREAARAVRALVVVADQEGAQVRQEVVTEQHEPQQRHADAVAGSAEEGVHKPRGGALSHNQIQRRKDEAVARNAKDVVEHIRGVASTFQPRVLVLAGSVQARTAIREKLPEELARILVETDRGGSAEHASEDALTEELLRIASVVAADNAKERTEALQAGLAHGLAVQGSAQVAHAVEMGALETLLFEYEHPVAGEAALLKGCAETSGAVALVADGSELTDGVGAALRFPLSA